jgi:hypothetical protein
MLIFGADSQEQADSWIRAQDTAIAAYPIDAVRRSQGKNLPLPAMIGDAPGFDLCPDPLTATSAAELIEALRQFRIWAGEPSLREMARASGHAIGVSTMSTALSGSKLPGLRILLTIVSACGGSHDHQQAFATAWRMLRMNHTQIRDPATSSQSTPSRTSQPRTAPRSGGQRARRARGPAAQSLALSARPQGQHQGLSQDQS